jgi:polysaccharide pyruvyl transferase WcaK-like protein
VDSLAGGEARGRSGSSMLAATLREALPDRGRRPLRVLIIGNYGNGNTGDESILAGLLSVMPGGLSITVVTRSPEAVESLHGIDGVRTTSPQAVVALLRSDAVLIGGGGMFGNGLPRLVALLPYVAIACSLLRKRVVYAAVGAYPGMPRHVMSALRFSARLSTAVTVRDAVSANVMSSGSAGRTNPVLVGDPAVWVQPASTSELADQIPLLMSAEQFLVVNLKATPDLEMLERVKRAVGSALASCRLDNSRVVFLCLSRQGDYGLGAAYSDHAIACEVSKLYLGEGATIVGPDLAPAVAKAVVAGAMGVIAMRLHAQIFADALGVPLLGLTFEAKSRAWLAESGSASLEVNDVSSESMVAWIDGLTERSSDDPLERSDRV